MNSPNCLHFTHANINLDAFFEMKDVTAQEYMFLAVVRQYQEFTGWCEPKVGNNLTYKQGLICHISARVRYSRQGGEKAYKHLIELGYLEEDATKTKFHCTMKFFVLTNPPKQNQAQNEAQKEAETLTTLKFSYNDTPFCTNLDAFTSELKDLCKKLPDNTDFKYYFEYIKQYYTKENTNAYTLDGWKGRLKSWLNKDIQARRVQLVKDLTTGGAMLPSDAMESVLMYGNLVSYPSQFTTFKKYKDDVLTYIKAVEIATPLLELEKDGNSKIEYKDRLKSKITVAGALLEFMNTRKEATKVKNTEGVKDDKTTVNVMHTEGVKKDKGTDKVTDKQKQAVNELLKLTENLKI